MKPINYFRTVSISSVWIWLGLFALLPFLYVVATSFLTYNVQTLYDLPLTLKNYLTLFDPIIIKVFIKSLYLAAICTLLCILLGYPFAYILAKHTGRFKSWYLLLVIIPFWTSSLIRSYAMMAILKAHGIINTMLMDLGIIHQPLQILYTNFAVIIGLVYNLLPFMILPIYANAERLDGHLIDAAYDLGASRFTTFRKIILPLTKPGILSGCLLVFLPAMTLFYIPDILGGSKSVLLGNLIQDQFLFAVNWPLGSAVSVMLTVLMSALLGFYWLNTRQVKERDLL